MKMDKEFLAKNRFWVLLAAAVPLTLIAIVYLLVVAPVQTAKVRADVNTKHEEIKKFSKFKNDSHVERAEKDLNEVKKLEKGVWEVAWKAQEAMYTWPGALDANFRFGYYIKSITIYPPDTKSDAMTPPVKEDKNSYFGAFHGVIEDHEGDVLTVRSLSKDEKAPREFLNPGSGKLTATAGEKKDLSWDQLDEYKGHKAAIVFEKGRAFGDDLTFDEQKVLGRKLKESDPLDAFQMQVLPILKEVGPLNDLGEPLVQFKGWTYSTKPAELFFKMEGVGGGGIFGAVAQPPQPVKEGEAAANSRGAFEFFPFVPKTWTSVVRGENYNSSKDAWTFQENLWVTRELYRQLRTVNEQVATFQNVGGDKLFQFENPYWRMEFKLQEEGKVEVTIKNLLDRRQKLPLAFKVKFDKVAKAVTLPPLKSPPLAARDIFDVVDGKKVLKDTHTQVFDLSEDFKSATPTKVLGVEQVLNWETAAVKRIDALHIGTKEAQSHRTFIKSPISFFPEKKEDKPADNPEEKPGDAVKGGRFPGGGEFGKDQVKTTPNGMVLERYLAVTPQSRRLPVALVVVADQDQTARIQAALADCKFRFLTTQVILNRCPESMRPPKKLEVVGPEFGGNPQPNPDDLLQASGSQDETNVELVIYGVITLYERYPQRPAAPAAGDTPPPP